MFLFTHAHFAGMLLSFTLDEALKIPLTQPLDSPFWKLRFTEAVQD